MTQLICLLYFVLGLTEVFISAILLNLFIWFWWPYHYNDVMVPSQIAYVLGANCIQALPNRSTATRGWHWGTMQRGPTVGPQGCYL
jgi:hypothetical protein